MNHDPLCPCNEPGHTHYEYAPSRLCTYCRCGLIAKVRDESKAAIAAAVEAERFAEYNRPFDEASRIWHERGQRDALNAAVQRVEGIPAPNRMIDVMPRGEQFVRRSAVIAAIKGGRP